MQGENKMKICSICDINWIEDCEDMCSVCKANNTPLKRTVSHVAHNSEFGEVFTFTSEPTDLRGKHGFKAYNSKGNCIGIVFMTDDKRSPSYACAELCMLPNYSNVYGEWHRIKSHGGRINWKILCERLNRNGKYECYID